MASSFQDSEHQQRAVPVCQPAAQEQRHIKPGAQPDKAEKGEGFDCEFVERPSEHLLQSECPVCLQIIRDPYQVTCCGYSYCHSCIERIKADSKPCPTCNADEISDFPDKRLKHSLNALQVRCSHHKDGCEWTGELGQLDDHLNKDPAPEKQLDGCQFAEINCLYCEEKKQRQYIQVHQKEHCTKRPFSCEYCHDYKSNYDDVIHNHWPVCGFHPVCCPNECGSFPQRQNLASHVGDECPLTTISCDLLHIGCGVKLPRKDMPEHLRENLFYHFSLLAVSHAQQQVQIEQLKQELSQGAKTNIPLGPPVLTMTNFKKHKKEGDDWISPPVYTHHHGYKISLRVHANGVSSGKGAYVSVSVVFLRGEFDDGLKWPFRGVVSFQLLDQVKGQDHKTRSITYDETMSDKVCGRVTEGQRAEYGWGVNVIAHTDLEPTYLRQDNLLFQIHRVELH